MGTADPVLHKIIDRSRSSRFDFVRWFRSRRMQAFLNHMQPFPGARIIDLGGTDYLWRLFDNDFDITLVNLPGTSKAGDSDMHTVYADACDLRNVFSDMSFDITFSNSVIEHVGGLDRQQLFAQEVVRLAPSYWIQTPSPCFPIEAHTGVLFYWQRTTEARNRMIERWSKKLPAWTEMVKGTTALTTKRMEELFPNSSIYYERILGFTKSITMYRPCEAV